VQQRQEELGVGREADVEQVADLLHGKEKQVWADSGYRGAQSRVKRDVKWHIAARRTEYQAARRQRAARFEMVMVDTAGGWQP
jgi:IS5 family transposase